MTRVESQDILTVFLTLLVGGAVSQLSEPYDLPFWWMAALGAGSALLLARRYVVERQFRDGQSTLAEPPLKRVSVAVWAFPVVLLAALALRLHGLLQRPAWEDEMWTLRNMYTSSWPELFRVAFEDYWPPLHYIVLNAIARVADTGLLTLRLPSVVFGVAGVAAMYPLGLELFRRRFPALVATAMLAGMTTHVMFSQEARVYSLQVLLVILSALFFYRAYWQSRVSWEFVLATTLLAYSHSFASWYFIAAQGTFVLLAWILWRDKERFRTGVKGQLLVGILTIPLAAAFAHSRFARGIEVPTYWAGTTRELPRFLDIVELYQSLVIRSWIGAAFIAILALLAVASSRHLVYLRGNSTRDLSDGNAPITKPSAASATLFLLCWVVIPILTSLAVTVFSSLETFGNLRYHLAVVPGMCLLVAAGASHVRTRVGRAAIAALLFLLPAAELPRYFRELRRPAVDDAAALIRENGKPGEPIFVGVSFRSLAFYLRGDFPRIGSADWERMAAQFAPLDQSFTMWGFKWGNTRAFEKIPLEVRYIGYWSPFVEDAQAQFAAEEVDRGHLNGAYWLVLRPSGDQAFVAAIERLGVRCDDAYVWHVEALELRRCNSGEPPPVLSP